MANEIREGSAPNFCPPVEEGQVFVFQDEKGELLNLEFLGLVLHNGRRYGFFFPISEDEPALSSGEVILLEVTDVDDEGQPLEFEYIDDEAIAAEAFEAFKVAAKDLYDFE